MRFSSLGRAVLCPHVDWCSSERQFVFPLDQKCFCKESEPQKENKSGGILEGSGILEQLQLVSLRLQRDVYSFPNIISAAAENIWCKQQLTGLLQRFSSKQNGSCSCWAAGWTIVLLMFVCPNDANALEWRYLLMQRRLIWLQFHLSSHREIPFLKCWLLVSSVESSFHWWVHPHVKYGNSFAPKDHKLFEEFEAFVTNQMKSSGLPSM